MANEGVSSYSEVVKTRPTLRTVDKDKKKETTNNTNKNVVGRLDSEAFKRRTKHLREIYLNPEKRHLYDWTTLEKKILLLDWYRNPLYYEEWKPLETEDMMNKFFSNMLYNFSQLSMAFVGTTVTFVKLLNIFPKLTVTYQCVAMIQRYFRPNSTYFDEFKLGLIWRGYEKNTNDDYAKYSKIIKQTHQNYQCLLDGTNFNIFTLTGEEFEKLGPCEECNKSQVVRKTTLLTPKITFPHAVCQMDVTTSYINEQQLYLLLIRLKDRIYLFDITKLISKTIKICKIWDSVRQKYCNKLENKMETEGKLCTGCLLTEEDFSELDKAKEVLSKYTISKPAKFDGIEHKRRDNKSVLIRKDVFQNGLKFLYTSVVENKRILPTHIASVSYTNGCVWSLSQMYSKSDLSEFFGTLNDPVLKMEFPYRCYPTDVSASLSVVQSMEDLFADKWLVEPKIYTTDDDGYLRLWTISKGLECSLRVELTPLLSVDVNKKYPHLIAIGGDAGKVKIYNLLSQSVSSSDALNTNLGVLTIPTYLPKNVYQYNKWYHPAQKIKWINDLFLAVHYGEPFYIKESTNAATLAIWNVYKDIFNKYDAFLSNRYWSKSKDSANTCYHLAGKLVCLYGGHFGSLGGMLSSDTQWTEEHGLFAVSSDNIGQLHWYKPGIWTWGDADDPMCLARIKSDQEFHQNILNNIEKEYDCLLKEVSNAVQGSSNYRKMRSNFSEFIDEAKSVLKQIEDRKPMKNDYKSIPSWAKKTLKVTPDEDKYMKFIKKEIGLKERMEYNLMDNEVQRNTGNINGN